MRFIYFFVLLTSYLSVFSQAEKRNTRFSIRGSVGIPKTVSSSMFRTAFNGVYEANLSVNTRLFNNFFVGVGYQNSHFQNNKKVFAFFLFPGGGEFLSYNTRLDGHAGFLKLGYDKFFSKGYVSYAINSGVMAFEYRNVNGDESKENQPLQPTKFNSPYIQPEFAVNFITDGRLSFSLLFSYTTLLYRFDPKAPRFNHFEQVNERKNRYVMSWINIGFGFNILLGKKN